MSLPTSPAIRNHNGRHRHENGGIAPASDEKLKASGALKLKAHKGRKTESVQQFPTQFFLYSLTVRHATLMPREWARKAPDLRLFRKTDLSKADFFRQFSGGKTKTSDFSSGKFRGFAPKVRMFCLKKSDVFMSIFCCFHPFFGLSRVKSRDFHHKNSN